MKFILANESEYTFAMVLHPFHALDNCVSIQHLTGRVSDIPTVRTFSLAPVSGSMQFLLFHAPQ